ncbi:MAG: glutathione S-transferase family protein [Gammaproteobacteria bacterium]|nr:glutathione S-transferase family protein [Gammaproteobacteria bacterium]
MSPLILHHYPPSPVSEKIRTALGLKQLSWRSVEQNRLPERPELLAMTGGYRRIPVLQIGADIYCDTQLIFRELERRQPTPSLFPDGDSGLPFALSRWTDTALFECCVKMAFAPAADSLPAELVADRARLYLGPTGDFKKEFDDLPHIVAQFKPQMAWLEARLKKGEKFIHGDQAGMSDLLAWYVVWFVKGRYPEADSLFEDFPAINTWTEYMQAIGHGQPSEMSSAEALELAKSTIPEAPGTSESNDAQGIKPGMSVSVAALGDSGESPVTGTVRCVTLQSITLDIRNELCGDVAVHFPRVGYRVSID